ncbi:MAG: MFS transporter [Clostridiales bacterium]|jgi:MFS family permease|nr:MFS transporter [Eubacteriales bacterium]MDH7567273.1 MFS transporter [Clostridiales bacterium]
MSEKKYGIGAKVAVLSIAVTLYLSSITTPIIGSIVKAFPNENPDLVKLIQTMPQFSTMIVALLIGAIESRIKRRTLVFTACGFLTIGGIAPMFLNSIIQILVARAVFGVGLGIAFPLASGIIGELFEGAERQQMMGLRGAVGTAAGFLFSLGAGFLAVNGWRHAFLLMLTAVLVFFVTFFKLPEPERKKSSGNGPAEKIRLSKWAYIIILLNIGYNILLLTYSVNMSVVVVVGKIGTVAQAGIVSSFYTIAAFLAGLSFAKIEQAIKRYTVALAVGLVGGGLLILLLANSITLFFAGAFILGFGFGLYNPCVTLKVIGSVDKQATTRAVSLYIVSQAGAQFLSPIIFMFITRSLGMTSVKAAWMIAAPTLLIATAAIILFVTFTKPKTAAATTVSQ